ncbi:hypothetical protein H0H92_012868 [Tricholoma furcatifolium]|nr:hypothetical protein H0H92_012868 [Tricholoma furcatifolium]
MDLPTIRPDSPSDDPPKTICVIGAGPVGLAALKVILGSPQYKSGHWKPTAFESRDKIFGLPAPPEGEPPQSSIYDSLTTNIPHPVMAYSSFPFPPSTPLFPGASIVLKYLEDYTEHFNLRPHIQLNTTVKSVSWDNPRWKIETSTGTMYHFDLVMVCNGHYRIPRYPNTPGIANWLSSGRASHSALYRRPHNLGDIVLVVGGGPSGQDISAEMCTAARTVIHSATGAVPETIGNLKRRGRVSSFDDNGQVTFEDGSIESGISHCILATGYEYSFPFFSESILRSAVPPPVPPLPNEIFNSTYNVFPLARHMFPLSATFPPSSLAFLGLLVRVAPFPLVESQARAVLHAFANPGCLEPLQEAVEIMTQYEELRDQVGDKPLAIAKAWHRFEPMQQFEYRDSLFEFCSTASNSNGDLTSVGVVSLRHSSRSSRDHYLNHSPFQTPIQNVAVSSVWEDLQHSATATACARDSYTRVTGWEKEMYRKKDVLRKAWRRLEELGQADEWVKGVGNGGVHEWAEMTKRLEKWYVQRSEHVQQTQNYRGAGVHSDKAPRGTSEMNDRIRFLDAFATAITTGNKGDVFAVSQHLTDKFHLILAKNGPPDLHDVEAAETLILALQNPSYNSLRESIRSLEKHVRKYRPPDSNITLFPDYLLVALFEDSIPSSETLLKTIIGSLTTLAVKGLPQDLPAAIVQMENLHLHVHALLQSDFLIRLLRDSKSVAEGPGSKPGGSSGVFTNFLNIHMAWNASYKKQKATTPQFQHLGLERNFLEQGRLAQASTRIWNPTIHARVHAELRIILHLDAALRNLGRQAFPIGVSKRSCFPCYLWIYHYNSHFKILCFTSGSHGKPYANWALPGTAAVDEELLQGIETRVRDTVKNSIGPVPARTISDEFVSSEDEKSYQPGGGGI